MDPTSEELNAAQRQFIQRLVLAGWVKQARETNQGVELAWTEDGAAKLHDVNRLLGELDFGSWTRIEKPQALLLLWWSLHVGWNEETLVSICGDSDLPPLDGKS